MYELHEMMTQEYATKMYRIEIERDKKEAREQGKAEGKAEGIVEGKLDAYIEMYHDGVISYEQLKKYSSLDDDSLKALIK